MTRVYGAMSRLRIIVLLEEMKGMLDAKAFLPDWYRVGSPAQLHLQFQSSAVPA